ncbi:MAG: hypothetical protein HY043_22320 [Verrucomicrobia bacterium]|nr:hypothetical protein [Verrucomicrobiota bacterium]
MPDEPQTDRQFARVMQLSVAVSLGFMAAFLWSLKQINPQVHIELSPGTLVVFLVAAVVSWFAWPKIANDGRRSRRNFLLFAGAVVLLTASAFIYGVKDVSRERLRDVAIGTTLAVLALSVLGFAIWRVGRFLEEDARTTADKRPNPDEPI